MNLSYLDNHYYYYFISIGIKLNQVIDCLHINNFIMVTGNYKGYLSFKYKDQIIIKGINS